MTKALVYAYSTLFFLGCLSGALSQSSGPLPGCRIVVRPTDKWRLPTKYRTPTDTANWQNGVCSTVKYTTPYRFGVDENVWIQKEGLSKFSCPNDSTTTYCVTSDYQIVRCGDIGCTQTTGLNTCSTPISQADCAFRNTEVAIEAALSDLELYWDEVMEGIEFWLKKWAGAIGMDILSELWGKKSTIIAAITQKVGTMTTVTPNNFKKIVVDSIKAAVPAAGKLFLTVGKGISFVFLVWDIMNWDMFVVKAY